MNEGVRARRLVDNGGGNYLPNLLYTGDAPKLVEQERDRAAVEAIGQIVFEDGTEFIIEINATRADGIVIVAFQGFRRLCRCLSQNAQLFERRKRYIAGGQTMLARGIDKSVKDDGLVIKPHDGTLLHLGVVDIAVGTQNENMKFAGSAKSQ